MIVARMMFKKHVLIPAIIIIVIFAATWWFNVGEGECPTTTVSKTVRGSSLSGFIENGQTIKVREGYYACNEVKRDDIVIYRYAGTSQIIKVVKGIPGDTFELRAIRPGRYNILIGGVVAQNSKNEPYLIGPDEHKMLSLYVRDYKGVIPKDAYLILGNLPGGSTDSTEFGLVGRKDLIGKVTSIR